VITRIDNRCCCKLANLVIGVRNFTYLNLIRPNFVNIGKFLIIIHIAVNPFSSSFSYKRTGDKMNVPTNGVWTSVDIPLSAFSPVNLSNVFQMKFDSGNGTTDLIYIDNIYFHN